VKCGPGRMQKVWVTDVSAARHHLLAIAPPWRGCRITGFEMPSPLDLMHMREPEEFALHFHPLPPVV
jgi:hypothetical protein